MWDLPGPGTEPMCPLLWQAIPHHWTREVLFFMNFFYSNRIQKAVWFVWHAPEWLISKTPTLAKGHKISQIWIKKKIAFYAFTWFTKCARDVSWVHNFLLNFWVTLTCFFHFVFTPRRPQSNNTQQLISFLKFLWLFSVDTQNWSYWINSYWNY